MRVFLPCSQTAGANLTEKDLQTLSNIAERLSEKINRSDRFVSLASYPHYSPTNSVGLCTRLGIKVE